MPKTTPAVPVVAVPGSGLTLPQGMPFSVYARGADAYEQSRINGPVTLKLDDGTTRTGTVQSMQVGALIDLISAFGPQSVYTAGRLYTPLGVVQALTDAGPDDVLDVTKLYTAFVVSLPVPMSALAQTTG